MDRSLLLDALEPRRLLSGTPSFDNPITFSDLAPDASFYKYEQEDFNVFARSQTGGGKRTLRVDAGDFGGQGVRTAGYERIRMTRDQDAAFNVGTLTFTTPAGSNAAFGSELEFALVGKFADGSTQTREVTMYAFAEVAVDWTDLVRVDVVSKAGVTSDGFPFSRPPVLTQIEAAYPKPPAAAGYDFEDVATGTYDSIAPSIAAFGKTAPSELVVHGPAQGYASNVLSTAEWGDAIVMDFLGAGATVHSLDVLAGRWGEAGDATIRGLGALTNYETTVSFDSKSPTVIPLGWTNVQILVIDFGGGVNEAYGAIDNVLFEGGQA